MAGVSHRETVARIHNRELVTPSWTPLTPNWYCDHVFVQAGADVPLAPFLNAQ